MKLIYVLAIPFMQSNFNNCKMILIYICLKHPFKNKANQCHNQRLMFLYHNHLTNSHSRSCIVPHFYSFHKHVYTEVRMFHWCTLKINKFQHIYVNLDNLNFRDHDKTSRYQEFKKIESNKISGKNCSGHSGSKTIITKNVYSQHGRISISIPCFLLLSLNVNKTIILLRYKIFIKTKQI